MYDDCVGFNTYGYIKYKINNKLIKLPNKKYYSEGLYIKSQQTEINYDKYTYYNNDLIVRITENIYLIIKIFDVYFSKNFLIISIT